MIHLGTVAQQQQKMSHSWRPFHGREGSSISRGHGSSRRAIIVAVSAVFGAVVVRSIGIGASARAAEHDIRLSIICVEIVVIAKSMRSSYARGA